MVVLWSTEHTAGLNHGCPLVYCTQSRTEPWLSSGLLNIQQDWTQTCHSIDMKNLDLTNKKSGSGGKNRDHGAIGYKKK